MLISDRQTFLTVATVWLLNSNLNYGYKKCFSLSYGYTNLFAINKVAYAVVLIVQCHMCRNIDKDQLTDIMPLAIFVSLKPTAFIHSRISNIFRLVEQRKTCSCETLI